MPREQKKKKTKEKSKSPKEKSPKESEDPKMDEDEIIGSCKTRLIKQTLELNRNSKSASQHYGKSSIRNTRLASPKPSKLLLT